MTRLLSAAAKIVDARSSRSRQRKVGASEIGVCRRRAGYSHHGHPVTDPHNVTGLPAIAGTWFHKGALDTMRREWGSLIEVRVEDDLLRGHVDALNLPNDVRVQAGLEEHPLAPDVAEVDDLKTKRDARMVDYVRNRGPKRSELFQVHLYADLLRRGQVKPIARQEKLAEVGPIDVQTVILRYLPRTGEEDSEYPHVQPFDPDVAAEAWEWVRQVSSSTSPDDLPRDEDGPGLSVACDYCPFVSACWGPQGGEFAPQAQLVVTDADLAATLADYDDARTAAAEAGKRKDLARAKLDATPPAIYVPAEDAEDGFKVGWSGGNTSDLRVDYEGLMERFQVMQDLYRQAGLTPPDVPYLEGRMTPRTMRVTRWKHPDPACGKPVGDPEPIAGDDGMTTLLQDRPRGGWTVYSRTGEEVASFTNGGFLKAHSGFVDPRPPCILAKSHSGDCQPDAFVVRLADEVEDLDVTASDVVA